MGIRPTHHLGLSVVGLLVVTLFKEKRDQELAPGDRMAASIHAREKGKKMGALYLAVIRECFLIYL